MFNYLIFLKLNILLKIFSLHIDFNKEKNKKIINDKIEEVKFINDWKQKLS